MRTFISELWHEMPWQGKLWMLTVPAWAVFIAVVLAVIASGH